MPKAIPDGYSTVTAYLVVKDAAKAIEFDQRAFGAKELGRATGPGDKGVMHAEIQIGSSRMMLSDEFPGQGPQAPQTLGGTSCQMFLYVENVDAAYQQAVSAGATAGMPPVDMFWGDRCGKLTDPGGLPVHAHDADFGAAHRADHQHRKRAHGRRAADGHQVCPRHQRARLAGGGDAVRAGRGGDAGEFTDRGQAVRRARHPAHRRGPRGRHGRSAKGTGVLADRDGGGSL